MTEGFSHRKKWRGWNIFSYKKKFSSRSIHSRKELLRAYKKAEECALSILAEESPDLYFGSYETKFGEEDLKRVENKLSHVLSAIDYKIAMRYINSTLSLGSRSDQLNWDVPAGLKQLILRKSLSNISVKSFTSMSEAKHLIHAFANVETGGQDLLCAAGKLLYSAVLFGGYDGTPIAFFDSLKHHKHHDSHGLCLEIDTDKNNVLPPEMRWHADPVTETLFLVLPKQQIKELGHTKLNKTWATKAFSTFSKKLALENDSRSVTFNELVQISHHLHAVYLPSFLSHVDGAKFLSRTLPNHTWERLKNRNYSETRIRIDKNNLPNISGNTQVHSSISYKEEKRIYYNGLNLFSGKKNDRLTRDNIIQIIHDQVSIMNIQPQESMALMLLLWGCKLLKQKKNNGALVSINTARQYLSSIGSKLIQVMSCRANVPSCEDEWIDSYNEMFELVSPNGLSTISRNTINFHRFISSESWACAINESPIRRYGAKGKTADVNLVTFHEFDAFLMMLNNAPGSRLPTMQRIVATLGFYAFLRVSEILSLRIKDVTSGKFASLTVAKNNYQDTKSRLSQRTIPIHALLPEDLLKELLDFREKRIEEASINNQKPNYYELLFCRSLEPTETLNYDFVVKPIMNNFRLITKDENIRFHHLRHSGANWTLIRLLAPHYPMIIDPSIDAFDHHEFSKERTVKLSHELMNAGNFLQPILYQVANLLGHATPKTTLQSYIHLGDLMTKQILEEHIEPQFSRNQLMAIFGIEKSALNNWNNRLQLGKQDVKYLSSYLPLLRNKIK